MFQIVRVEACNPGPMTGTGNHTYLLIEPGGGALLVDAGIGEPEHVHALTQALQQRGAHLDLVIVTHAHEDHIRGVPALTKAFPSARFAKYPRPGVDEGCGARWEPIADGDSVVIAGERVEILHTPGHAPDHLALWHRPSRTAWTGDLVAEDTSVTIDWSGGGSLEAYLHSLQRVLELSPERLLPAHGPDVANPRALIRRQIEHRLTRERQVLSAVEGGASTVEQIAEAVYDGLAPALMAAAVDNIHAHLERLQAAGSIREQDGGWHSAK